MIEAKASQRAVHPLLARVIGIAVACGLVCLVPLATGCSTSPVGSSSAAQAPATEAVTTTVAPVSAATLATGVVETWAEAMQRLAGLLETMPQPDAIRAEVENLKEEYIQRFVAYGRQRLELTPAVQEEMSSLVFAGISPLAEEPWYKNYMSLYDQYSTGDLEFANLLASFNILTQYADFALLKQQEPEEAARLSVE